MPLLFLDFETRSTRNLALTGAWKYSRHESTDVWCACFAVDAGEVKVWQPGDPVPIEIIEAAADPSYQLCAHNAAFERSILTNILTPRYGWPAIGLDQFRDTMAKARKLRKDETGIHWHTDPAKIARLIEYCRQDVEVERALHMRLTPLSANEQSIWYLNERINEFGIPLDRPLLAGAIKAAERTEEKIKAEFSAITGLSPDQTKKLLPWLQDAGVDV